MSKKMQRCASVVFVATLFLFTVAATAVGQVAVNSTIRGVVQDPQGNVVPNATLTLTSVDRPDQRQVKTSNEGSFVFPSVVPGKYHLKVEANGFKTSEQPELSIAPIETRSLNIALEVGAPSETVTITSEPPPIKTDTGERSDTITAKQIDNLSIIGRSSLELLRILPGVVAPDPSDPSQAPDFTTFQGGANANGNYTVNGIRGVNNNVSIDGSRVIDIGANNGTIITANNDMVQEVTVKSSNFAAEYGSSGVQITATTKGGTKDFHGEIYDYFRPRSLQASDRSISSVGGSKPLTKFQYPGGNIGGPVLLPFTKFNRNRDRLFFFTGLEFQRQTRDPGAKLGTVPTQAERNGDFSHSQSGRPGNVFCPPDTYQFNSCTAVPNANYTAFKDPTGAALLSLFPLPNFSGTGARSRFNYQSAVISPQNRTDLKMRFDYKVTDNTSLYVRLARESENDDAPYGIWWGPSTFELPSHLVGTNLGRSAAVNVTSLLSPSMTNEVVFSASKLKLNYDFSDPGKVTKQALGISNLQLPWGAKSPTPYAPLALISWDVGSQMWEPGNLPLFANNDSYSVTDNLSKILSKHTLRFGGLVERASKVQDQSGPTEGQIEYEGFNQAKTTGNAFANLYTGRINGIDQTTRGPIGTFRFWNIEGYAQDSWKVRPNITLEYGLRLSYLTNNAEQTGLGVVFDPTAYVRGAGPYIGGDLNKPNGVLQERLGQIPKGIFDSNPGILWGPRLNLAWDMFKDGSTVLRGGGGIFYNRVQGNYQYVVLTAPPNVLSAHADSWGAPNNDITLTNLGTFDPTKVAPGSSCRAAGNCPGVATQDRNSNDIPTIYSTSLSLARRLPFQNVLEVAYVGTFGRHLPQTYGFNFVTHPILSGTVGNANMADPLQRAALGANQAGMALILPFPDYNSTNGGVRLGEFTGTSNYHSLQVTLNRQLSNKLQYFLTYTFSKALGTTSVNESDGDQSPDPVDTKGRSYGILSYDRTHIFNLSYNYYIPDLARGSFSNWFTNGLLNGWQWSGITTIQSGKPIRLKLSGAILGDNVLMSYFGYNARAGGNSGVATGIAPIILPNLRAGGSDINGSFLDLSAVQLPGFGQNGPFQSPFYVRGPTTSNFDVTFFKNFNITESKKLQFRTGLFNIFNQAFANPDLGDINLTLDTVCNRSAAAGINNGTGQTTAAICDPTGGFSFTTTGSSTDTIHNFGKIINKHGHRRIELAIKFYF
jgi:hypothetical protein